MNAQLFVLTIAVILVVVAAIILVSKNRHRIKRVVFDRLVKSLEAYQRNRSESEPFIADSDYMALTTEQRSKAELDRLQKVIEDRKQVARKADISHHLWNFYKNHFRQNHSQPLSSFNQNGDWFDVNILDVSTKNDLNKFEFELGGAKYTFIDDEEKQGWSMNVKFFSLFLSDESGRCLIEIPMKVNMDAWGRKYSISSDGPKAFLPGDWVNDFVNTSLKHQHMRNQEIREQKHQERLWEIKDLKDRFGIKD